MNARRAYGQTLELSLSATAPEACSPAIPSPPQAAASISQEPPQPVQLPATQYPSHQPKPGRVCSAVAEPTQSARIKTRLATSLFIQSVSFHQSCEYAALELLKAAERAYRVRRLDEVGGLATALIQSGPARYAGAGWYFLGLAALGEGRGNVGLARQSFEQAIRLAGDHYRGRALLSLASVYNLTGEYSEEIHLCQRLARGPDLFTSIEAHRVLAIWQSIDGQRARAFDHLSELLPIARRFGLYSRVYLECLNSYATEAHAAGQSREAREAGELLSSLPLVAAFPEARETAREIAEQQAQPVIVAVPELKRSVAVGAPAITPRASSVERRRRRLLCRQQLSPLTFTTRAQIRAGPRAPPIVPSEK